MTRRVLMVAPQPFFEDRGTPIALAHVLRALSELGCAVDVLTVPVGRHVEIPGVRLIRVGNPFGVRRMPIGLSLTKLVFDVLLWRKFRRLIRHERYAYVHAVEESAFFAAWSARRRGVPVLYDMQASLPEALEQHPVLGARPFGVVSRWFERRLLRRVNGVACSAGLEGYVARVAPGTPCWPWIFPSSLESPRPGDVLDLRRELSIADDAVVAVYTGSFAKYQGVELLLQAAPHVVREVPNAHVVIVGARDAEQASALEGALPHDVRGRVRVLPRAAKERIPAYLGLADVVVSLRIHGLNAPLKLFDYLSAGKAIVATDIPAHRAVLSDEVAVLAPANAEGVASALVSLLADEARRESLARAAEAYAEVRLTWRGFVGRVAATTAVLSSLHDEQASRDT